MAGIRDLAPRGSMAPRKSDSKAKPSSSDGEAAPKRPRKSYETVMTLETFYSSADDSPTSFIERPSKAGKACRDVKDANVERADTISPTSAATLSPLPVNPISMNAPVVGQVIDSSVENYSGNPGTSGDSLEPFVFSAAFSGTIPDYVPELIAKSVPGPVPGSEAVPGITSEACAVPIVINSSPVSNSGCLAGLVSEMGSLAAFISSPAPDLIKSDPGPGPSLVSNQVTEIPGSRSVSITDPDSIASSITRLAESEPIYIQIAELVQGTIPAFDPLCDTTLASDIGGDGSHDVTMSDTLVTSISVSPLPVELPAIIDGNENVTLTFTEAVTLGDPSEMIVDYADNPAEPEGDDHCQGAIPVLNSPSNDWASILAGVPSPALLDNEAFRSLLANSDTDITPLERELEMALLNQLNPAGTASLDETYVSPGKIDSLNSIFVNDSVYSGIDPSTLMVNGFSQGSLPIFSTTGQNDTQKLKIFSHFQVDISKLESLTVSRVYRKLSLSDSYSSGPCIVDLSIPSDGKRPRSALSLEYALMDMLYQSVDEECAMNLLESGRVNDIIRTVVVNGGHIHKLLLLTLLRRLCAIREGPKHFWSCVVSLYTFLIDMMMINKPVIHDVKWYEVSDSRFLTSFWGIAFAAHTQPHLYANQGSPDFSMIASHKFHIPLMCEYLDGSSLDKLKSLPAFLQPWLETFTVAEMAVDTFIDITSLQDISYGVQDWGQLLAERAAGLSSYFTKAENSLSSIRLRCIFLTMNDIWPTVFEDPFEATEFCWTSLADYLENGDENCPTDLATACSKYLRLLLEMDTMDDPGFCTFRQYLQTPQKAALLLRFALAGDDQYPDLYEAVWAILHLLSYSFNRIFGHLMAIVLTYDYRVLGDNTYVTERDLIVALDEIFPKVSKLLAGNAAVIIGSTVALMELTLPRWQLEACYRQLRRYAVDAPTEKAQIQRQLLAYRLHCMLNPRRHMDDSEAADYRKSLEKRQIAAQESRTRTLKELKKLLQSSDVELEENREVISKLSWDLIPDWGIQTDTYIQTALKSLQGKTTFWKQDRDPFDTAVYTTPVPNSARTIRTTVSAHAA